MVGLKDGADRTSKGGEAQIRPVSLSAETQSERFLGASRMHGGHWTDGPLPQEPAIFTQILHKRVTPEGWEKEGCPGSRWIS